MEIETPPKVRPERYLAYIDYLGTRELYRRPLANAELIEDRRYELEHGIHFRLQRLVAERKIEIGVFSDTVLIAGEDAQQVFTSAAVLLNFVLQKTLSRSNGKDVRLLRGGVSKGIELRAGYLRPAPGISVIPFFDSSLAFAYELEEVRRGSRLYLDSNIVGEDLGPLSKYTFAWSQMAGFGKPTSDAREFLWPALLYADKISDLTTLLDDCMALWRKIIEAETPDPDVYRATLYHFDETIKIIIRSLVALPEGPDLDGAIVRLISHLPRPEDTMDGVDIRFVWGVWFQIVYVLTRHGLTERHQQHISFMFKELKRRQYFDKFVAEIDHPDYEIMRPLLRFS